VHRTEFALSSHCFAGSILLRDRSASRR
jgi:hypothetical protein